MRQGCRLSYTITLETCDNASNDEIDAVRCYCPRTVRRWTKALVSYERDRGTVLPLPGQRDVCRFRRVSRRKSQPGSTHGAEKVQTRSHCGFCWGCFSTGGRPQCVPLRTAGAQPLAEVSPPAADHIKSHSDCNQCTISPQPSGWCT